MGVVAVKPSYVGLSAALVSQKVLAVNQARPVGMIPLPSLRYVFT